MLRYRTLYLPWFVFYIEFFLEWKSVRLELLTSIYTVITYIYRPSQETLKLGIHVLYMRPNRTIKIQIHCSVDLPRGFIAVHCGESFYPLGYLYM